jgi:hypothetical protein
MYICSVLASIFVLHFQIRENRVSKTGLPDFIYQNGGKDTKLSLNYQMAQNIPNVFSIFQMA